MKYSRRAWSRLIRERAIGPAQACFVCGLNRGITHAHHVIPVALMADLLTQYEISSFKCTELRVPYVWLCPNHHAIWHKLNGQRAKVTDPLWEELSQAELDAYGQLNTVESDEWSNFNRFLIQNSGDGDDR